jgi:hypothetical protein
MTHYFISHSDLQNVLVDADGKVIFESSPFYNRLKSLVYGFELDEEPKELYERLEKIKRLIEGELI